MTIHNVPIFAVYTGNRFNQVLLFATWNDAAEWCRKSTRWTEEEIARAIKTPRFDGSEYISLFDI